MRALLCLLLACDTPSRLGLTPAGFTEATPPAGVETGPAPPEAEPDETAPRGPVINELCADNDSLAMTEAGQTEDWVELYGAGEAAVDLAGWRLIDGDGQTLLTLSGSLPAAGRALFFLPDGLPASAGSLSLVDPTGAVADRLSWVDLSDDRVRGRFPDGSAYVANGLAATPGGPNPYEPGDPSDPSAALFDPTRILPLDLVLSAAAIDALNRSPYEEVAGGLGVGAVYLSPVGVRLKGQWGSLRDLNSKAGFKIDLNEWIEGVEVLGVKMLTLNSMVQDPSFVHEHLAYTLFRDLDVPTPRVGYVWLSLNGEPRGLYLNVETPDDRLLGRWFDDVEGNLYEGEYGQDLTDGSYTGLDLDQHGERGADPYTDLAPLVALLQTSPSEEAVPELEALVDVDRALMAFAVESLIGHWDGYLFYPNNFRFYVNPTDGRATYLPWGTDQTFDWWSDPYAPSGALARWMLAVPSLRTRYDFALWEAAEAMDRLALDEEARQTFARLEASIAADPYKEVSPETAAAYLESSIAFLESRPVSLLDDLF